MVKWILLLAAFCGNYPPDRKRQPMRLAVFFKKEVNKIMRFISIRRHGQQRRAAKNLTV